MQEALVVEIKSLIREIPDFPKPGVLFRDITPVLTSGPTLLRLIDHFKARYAGLGISRVVGIESRGFIFGAALAYSLGIGLALVRKPGKLPYHTNRVEYDLEYGSDGVEIHVDGLEPGEQVVVMDDLLATGGTAGATIRLVEQLGAVVHEVGFLIELTDLAGREKLPDRPIYSLVRY
jgi:adenine phosphoribosyltransferase